MYKVNLSLLLFLVTCHLEVNSGETNDILQFWKRDPGKVKRAMSNKGLSTENSVANKKIKNRYGEALLAKFRRNRGNNNFPKMSPISTRMWNNWTKMQEEEEPRTSKPVPVDAYETKKTLDPYDIKHQLTRITSIFSKASTTVEVIGRTVEYNDIVLLKITESLEERKRFRMRADEKYVTDGNEKKIIFIVHGLVILGFRNMPCLSEEESFAELLDIYLSHLHQFDIYIIPLANPDGIAKEKPFWNKNVSPQKDCGGVFLDRNFDIAWNRNHTISSCSQLYPGPEPFSEEESKAVRDVIHKYGTRIIAYINVHAMQDLANTYKGDAVLYPKGFTDAQSDEDKYIDLKGEIEEAMNNASFYSVTVHMDTLYNWYGKVSGASIDYASKVYGIPNALEFVMQLYDTSFNDDYVVTYEHTALICIWKRIIDTVFNFIHESSTSNNQE